ncbi:zinc-binding alcohol dehydrogenase family protein [Aspergillus undulatus]|uniref:zinc-binding alcohol dehydrogenase family protein n=1 Tax=Aspergillus undulatus TaxID=1810928 RepID=UPI003CCE2E34
MYARDKRLSPLASRLSDLSITWKSASQHRAATPPAKGSPLSVTHRPTPTPGPSEVLIKVHAVALNPVDWCQRNLGFPPIAHYPAVLGSDVAGVVERLGPDLPTDPNTTPALRQGTRVVALASGFYKGGLEDYSAFQEYVLVSAECEGAVLPLAVFTAWNGWCGAGLGFDFETRLSPNADGRKEALLMGVAVYTAASGKHHEYMRELGADRVFDYRDEDVVKQIINAARSDGVELRVAYGAVPDSLLSILGVLQELKEKGQDAKVAYAPPLPDYVPTVEGIEVKFVFPPLEPEALHQRFAETPHVRVVGGGLDELNNALDILKGGVSGTKIVLKLRCV